MTKVEYTLRRLVLAFVVLVGVSIVTFAVARLVPSNPAAKWVGPRARPEQVEAARTNQTSRTPQFAAECPRELKRAACAKSEPLTQP